MASAGARLAAGLDLASFRKMPSQSLHVLVIDFADVVHAECADLPARTRSTTTTAAAAKSAWRPGIATLGSRSRPTPAKAGRALVGCCL